MRGDRLTRLTHDHTVTAELVSAGALGAADAAAHPHRNVLTRAIGAARRLDAEFASVPCAPGDRFVLCTDGLHQALDLDELTSAPLADAEPRAAADALVAEAVRRGADDNVTALVVDVR